MNIFQNYQAKEATYIMQNKSYTMRCLPSMAFRPGRQQKILKVKTIDRCIHRKIKIIVQYYENPIITTRPVPPAQRCCWTI